MKNSNRITVETLRVNMRKKATQVTTLRMRKTLKNAQKISKIETN